MIELAAAIAALVMLLTHSKVATPVRDRLPDYPFSCPVCLSFWASLPAAYWAGPIGYLATVTFSNLFMLGIAKLYLAVEDLDYEDD